MKYAGLFVAVAIVVTGCGGDPAPRTVSFPPPMSIAPLEEALTFARAEVDGKTHLLAVLRYGEEKVDAIDLTVALPDAPDDPVTLFNAMGYDAVRGAIETNADKMAEFPIDSLVMPVALKDAHVAAGTNFAAHAEESSVEDGPFLFAKMVTPTPFTAEVSAGDALLDYEVELALVTLEKSPVTEVPEFMGLILSNDVTDRAKLMRHLNPDDVASGEGFTTGKSAEGYLPVGNLFVIPRDLHAFVNNLYLHLAVDGEMRQEAPMTFAIWDIDELFRQIDGWQDVVWTYQGEDVSLPVEDGALPERTLIMCGTPAGTVFDGISNGVIASGVTRWVFGGWDESVANHAIDAYIEGAREDGNYLQPGDEVQIWCDGLGVIVNTVVE